MGGRRSSVEKRHEYREPGDPHAGGRYTCARTVVHCVVSKGATLPRRQSLGIAAARECDADRRLHLSGVRVAADMFPLIPRELFRVL